MDNKKYEYWFSGIKGITADRKREIRKEVSILEIYNIEETAKKILKKDEVEKILLAKEEKNWKDEYERFTEKGIHFISCKEDGFPKRFIGLKGMPYGIYYKGKLQAENNINIAIVGARKCSAYGERMTLKFAETLAGHGITIISGMARGVDGIAHRGALNMNGTTIAILGNGVDICYPREHLGLYRDIESNGCLISEFPPGTPPFPQNFPARNRIISGLSDIVLVMEAKEKSGSLITADMALEQGKDVYALPGPIESELSRGCNKLISQGAGTLLGVSDFLEEMNFNSNLSQSSDEEKGHKNKIMLETSENLVYSRLGFYPKNREEILRETNLLPQELNRILVALELKGYITERSNNYYIRNE